MAYEEKDDQSAVADTNPVHAPPRGVTLSGGTSEVGEHVAEEPGRDEGRDDETEGPKVDLACLEVEREQVRDGPQSNALGRSLEEGLEDSHRSEHLQVGSDGAADREAETENLGPEEDGETSVALDEEDSAYSTGACECSRGQRSAARLGALSRPNVFD